MFPVVATSAVLVVPCTVNVPSTFKASLMFTVVESAELIVVPFNVNPAATTEPVPPGVMFMSEFDAEVIFASWIVKLSMLVVVSVVTPLTPSVELAVTAPVNVLAPLTLIVPSTTNASLTLIAVESDESNVVPLTLSELKTTSPVPPGVILISAFEADEIILSCIVKLSMFVVVKV